MSRFTLRTQLSSHALQKPVPNLLHNNCVIMDITYESIQEAATALRKFLPKDFAPKIGIICGSGLSAIADAVDAIVVDGVRDEISYRDIKGFPVSGGKFAITVGESRREYEV